MEAELLGIDLALGEGLGLRDGAWRAYTIAKCEDNFNQHWGEGGNCIVHHPGRMLKGEIYEIAIFFPAHLRVVNTHPNVHHADNTSEIYWVDFP